jgi:hypothetical protein
MSERRLEFSSCNFCKEFIVSSVIAILIPLNRNASNSLNVKTCTPKRKKE